MVFKRILGLVAALTVSMSVPCFGAVNNPDDAEREKARIYLSEANVEIPEDVEFWCRYYGRRYGICPEILEAVCWVESRCIPSAQSDDKKCKGLMQIRPSCHQERMSKLNALNVFGVADNIKIGADYLAELGEKEDIAVVLTIYNGQSKAKIEKARNGEYSKYVKDILSISEALERMDNK